MVRSVIKSTKKYIRLYLLLVKFAAKRDLEYWQNFFISLLVEFMYTGGFFLFYAIFLYQTGSIAGWGVNEIIVLLGIDTITSEVITAAVVVFNTREIPRKIWSGELDRDLLKPINPLFTLMFGRPYFPSFIDALFGPVLIVIGLSALNWNASFLGIASAFGFFIMGMVIVICIITNFSLLTFFFQDTKTFPRIGERLVYSYSGRPHDIYQGFTKLIFLLLLPIGYVSSFATKSLTVGIDPAWLVGCFLLMILSLLLTKFMWNKAIRNYSSASS